MRLAIVGAATGAGLIGIGLVTGALLVVATVAAERTLVRGVSGKLLGRKRFAASQPHGKRSS